MNATVAIRRGDRDDRAFVLDLGRRTASSSLSAVRGSYGEDVLVAFDRLIDFCYARDHLALIAEDGSGERLGFLLLLFDIPDEVTLTDQGFVAYTAVEPHARTHGIGRKLLDEAERHARARGRRYMSLMVTEDNTAARSLYGTAGYATERRMLTKEL